MISRIQKGSIYRDGLKHKVGKFIRMPQGLHAYVNGEWFDFPNEYALRARWPGYVCVVEEKA